MKPSTTRPAASAASKQRAASAGLVANGFSHSTCLPASRPNSDANRWALAGSRLATATNRVTFEPVGLDHQPGDVGGGQHSQRIGSMRLPPPASHGHEPDGPLPSTPSPLSFACPGWRRCSSSNPWRTSMVAKQRGTSRSLRLVPACSTRPTGAGSKGLIGDAWRRREPEEPDFGVGYIWRRR